jgi:hypothetical protein
MTDTLMQVQSCVFLRIFEQLNTVCIGPQSFNTVWHVPWATFYFSQNNVRFLLCAIQTIMTLIQNREWQEVP